jgi:DNA-binding response OmpR family regulator
MEALRYLADVTPDLLILDLNMPQIGGHDVIRTIRQERNLLQLPIIVLSADDEDASQDKAFSLGADDYITKPFTPAVVASRVHAALRRPK